jgi:hypothetical protein
MQEQDGALKSKATTARNLVKLHNLHERHTSFNGIPFLFRMVSKRQIGGRNGVGAGFGQLHTSSGGHTYGRVKKKGHFGSAKAIIQ